MIPALLPIDIPVRELDETFHRLIRRELEGLASVEEIRELDRLFAEKEALGASSRFDPERGK
jgi:hypothetical protein